MQSVEVKMISGYIVTVSKVRDLVMFHSPEINMQLPIIAMRYQIDPTGKPDFKALRLLNMNDMSFAMTWYIDAEDAKSLDLFLKSGWIQNDG